MSDGSDWSDWSDWSDGESDEESDREMRERLARQSTTALSPGDSDAKTDFTAMGLCVM